MISKEEEENLCSVIVCGVTEWSSLRTSTEYGVLVTTISGTSSHY